MLRLCMRGRLPPNAVVSLVMPVHPLTSQAAVPRVTHMQSLTFRGLLFTLLLSCWLTATRAVVHSAPVLLADGDVWLLFTLFPPCWLLSTCASCYVQPITTHFKLCHQSNGCVFPCICAAAHVPMQAVLHRGSARRVRQLLSPFPATSPNQVFVCFVAPREHSCF